MGSLVGSLGHNCFVVFQEFVICTTVEVRVTTRWLLFLQSMKMEFGKLSDCCHFAPVPILMCFLGGRTTSTP